MYPILYYRSGLIIYTYPLILGLACGVAYQLSRYMILQYRGSLEGFRGLFWGTFISSWIGAKIFFLLNTSGSSYTSYIINSSFWLGGGFVFYGGMIFGLLFVLVYCLLFKNFPFNQLHLILPSVCFAHSIGRLGCLFAGCCYGKPSKIFWSIYLHGEYRHPVQLYEALMLLGLGIFLWWAIAKKVNSVTTIILYVLFYSTLRFILEFLRDDKLRGFYTENLSSGQIISLALIIIVLLLLFVKKKWPGRWEKSNWPKLLDIFL